MTRRLVCTDRHRVPFAALDDVLSGLRRVMAAMAGRDGFLGLDLYVDEDGRAGAATVALVSRWSGATAARAGGIDCRTCRAG